MEFFSNRGLNALIVVPALVFGGPCITALLLKKCVPGVKGKRKFSTPNLDEGPGLQEPNVEVSETKEPSAPIPCVTTNTLPSEVSTSQAPSPSDSVSITIAYPSFRASFTYSLAPSFNSLPVPTPEPIPSASSSSPRPILDKPVEETSSSRNLSIPLLVSENGSLPISENSQKCSKFHTFVKQYIQSVPWSIFLGLFEFCADTVNLITSLIVWIDEWKSHPNPLDHREHVYALLAFIIILYVTLELIMIRSMYEHFFHHPMARTARYLQAMNKLYHNDCTNPRNIKFWLWIWYYPNMCVLAPNAALLKVWFHWIGVGYTIYFLRTHPITPALVGKLFDLIIEIPVSVAQLVIITISFIQLRQINDVKLKDEEWCDLVKRVYADNWWTPLPRLTTEFLAAKKRKQTRRQEQVAKKEMNYGTYAASNNENK